MHVYLTPLSVRIQHCNFSPLHCRWIIMQLITRLCAHVYMLIIKMHRLQISWFGWGSKLQCMQKIKHIFTVYASLEK